MRYFIPIAALLIACGADPGTSTTNPSDVTTTDGPEVHFVFPLPNETVSDTLFVEVELERFNLDDGYLIFSIDKESTWTSFDLAFALEVSSLPSGERRLCVTGVWNNESPATEPTCIFFVKS
jgi:hypothetical protein